jgi:putative membrane protein
MGGLLSATSRSRLAFIHPGEQEMRRSAVAVALVAAAMATSVAIAQGFARPDTPSPAPLDDAAIVAIFDLANTADIETGRLGAERASNKEVRDYGTMLSQVHTEVRQKGRDLAKKLGVKPVLPADNTMGKDHAAAVARLSNLRGAEFDRAFLEHEEAFHAAVIAAVTNTLLPAIKNQELKDFVTSLAPAFEAHRVMAVHLAEKIAN